MLRSAYMAQELLSTFSDQIKGVSLIPSETGGAFLVHIDDKLIFDRNKLQRFPEIKELKRLVRDVVNPEMNLGQTDR